MKLSRTLGCLVMSAASTLFLVATLGSIGLPPGTQFITVFRFFAAAGLLTYLSAMVSQSIWFDNRIVGHIVESIGYALIVGAIFGGLWPAA